MPSPFPGMDPYLEGSTWMDLSDYNLEVDYTKPPDMSLSPEEATWLDTRVRAVGLRT
jgi:hypothetical protein